MILETEQLRIGRRAEPVSVVGGGMRKLGFESGEKWREAAMGRGSRRKGSRERKVQTFPGCRALRRFAEIESCWRIGMGMSRCGRSARIS